MINNQFHLSSINCLNMCSKNLVKLLDASTLWENRLKSDYSVADFKLYKNISPIEVSEARSMYYQLVKNRTFKRFFDFAQV